MGKIIIYSNSISPSACHFVASWGGSQIWTGTKTHQSFKKKLLLECVTNDWTRACSQFPPKSTTYFTTETFPLRSCLAKTSRNTDKTQQKSVRILSYRASVHTILLSMWSKVSPLGQAPVSMSLKTTCRRFPLMEAPSIRGNVASQSVQNRALLTIKLKCLKDFQRRACKPHPH